MAAVEPHRLAAPASAGMYSRHYGRVLSYCLWRLGKREDAEDAAQATFLNAHQALSRGTTPRSEASWLLAIANNVCLARWRAQRGRPSEIAHEPEALAAHAAPELDAQLLPALRDALACLPEQQRQAFVMREWHGCSYAEIAEELRTTEAAVASLVFRARQSLAEALGDERPERRFGNLGAGSVLGWVKSLLGGTAAKLALAGAGSVLVVATATVATSQPRGHGAIRVTRPHAAAASVSRPTTPVARRRRAAAPHSVKVASPARPRFSHASSRPTAPASHLVAPRPVSVSPAPPSAPPAAVQAPSPAPSSSPSTPSPAAPQPTVPVSTPPAPVLPPPPPVVSQVVGTATQLVGQVTSTVTSPLTSPLLPKLGR